MMIILIAIVIVAINVYHNKDNRNNTDNTPIKGTFKYNEKVKYEFGENGKGAMYDGDTKYEYDYTIQNNAIMIDFKNENVYDATYTYIFKDNTLTLVGGKGTMGGKYILEKEENEF